MKMNLGKELGTVWVDVLRCEGFTKKLKQKMFNIYKHCFQTEAPEAVELCDVMKELFRCHADLSKMGQQLYDLRHRMEGVNADINIGKLD